MRVLYWHVKGDTSRQLVRAVVQSDLKINLDLKSSTVIDLQEKKLKCDEKIKKLIVENEMLKLHIKTFKQNEQVSEGLEAENKKLKNKSPSILKNLLSENNLKDDLSQNPG